MNIKIKRNKRKSKKKGYFLMEVLVCIFLFSIFVFIISIFLKRIVIIENTKNISQKKYEKIYFIFEKIEEDIENRDREKFLYNNEEKNIHIDIKKNNQKIIYKKDNIFYKLEYKNKKLTISNGRSLSNWGNSDILGEYEKLEISNIDELLILKIKNNKEDEVKILNLL